jgi:dihydrofolate reductase
MLIREGTVANFSRDWPKITDPDDPFVGKLNGLPKYLASHSLRKADEWVPTVILSGDVVAQVVELKQQPGRELQIHGSAQLAQSMLAAGLIDTMRLLIAPVMVGTGRRLFPEGGARPGCGSSATRRHRVESRCTSTSRPGCPRTTRTNDEVPRGR